MHHIMCELPVGIITLLADSNQFPHAPEKLLYVDGSILGTCDTQYVLRCLLVV